MAGGGGLNLGMQLRYSLKILLLPEQSICDGEVERESCGNWKICFMSHEAYSFAFND